MNFDILTPSEVRDGSPVVVSLADAIAERFQMISDAMNEVNDPLTAEEIHFRHANFDQMIKLIELAKAQTPIVIQNDDDDHARVQFGEMIEEAVNEIQKEIALSEALRKKGRRKYTVN